MDFTPVISNDRTKKFEESLPTSIFQDENIVKIFGKSPDIDSTVLMISTTSWILAKLLEKGNGDASGASTFSHSSSAMILCMILHMSTERKNPLKRDQALNDATNGQREKSLDLCL